MKYLLLILLLWAPNVFADDKITLQVEGMTCPLCASKVESNLKRTDKISEININIAKGEALADKTIEEALQDAGYKLKKNQSLTGAQCFNSRFACQNHVAIPNQLNLQILRESSPKF